MFVVIFVNLTEIKLFGMFILLIAQVTHLQTPTH